ncbi:hypothetical protein [Bythopirellula polymerisocia]|uniref:Uncharacterized protein n=1 Tax=Bythopirellula polymerisocia TaxID=2528003 RepID=A0A5C6CJH1_9BACT|nr:hypothetical protein [Bythopirellula polymerisocia]TWU23727.1 hypothetical protein Pla144_39020 [Bythopirellula polymerisocia]
MSESANVHSVEAIERFRAALAQFEKRMQGALDTLTAELQRANNWLEQDCPHFWKEQEKLAADAVHQAKLDVERCLILAVTDERPACREERAALAVAKNRLTYCHDKKGLVKHWRGVMNHEMFEYSGRIGHLQRILETELPAARAKLQLIVRRVEGYQIERPPDYQEAVPGATRIARDSESSGAAPSPES